MVSRYQCLSSLFCNLAFLFSFVSFLKKKIQRTNETKWKFIQALLFSLKLKNLMNIKFFRHNMCTNAIKVVT